MANDILAALLEFFTDPQAQQEIIVLDFHEFRDFTPQAHTELQALIIDTLQSRIIPSALEALTVGEIWQQYPGQNVVVAYNHYTDNRTFWNGVDQYWSANNLISTSALKSFMDSAIERYKSRDELVSMQCAKYVLPFFVPDDFNDKIDVWFKSEDKDSYIQKFFIINTDWSTRSQLVHNCQHANHIKGQPLNLPSGLPN